MKYFVESYGCTMNYGEGNELSEKMRLLGHVPSATPEDADIVVLNTCTVVDTTEKKMLKRISELKTSGKEIIVTGCMAKAQPSRIQLRLPDSIILPPEDYDSFSSVAGERYGCSEPSVAVTGSTSAVLPIAQGCLGACSYCITKMARGKLRSYPSDELVQKFRNIVENGATEILMTAQDTACYGTDIGTDLPSLLTKMLEIPGEYRIRIGMMNPNNLSPILDGLLEVMDDPRVYKFIHIPVQSGSDYVLERMNRKYTVEEFMDLVDRIRKRYRDISIATDIITGFPGETDDDHTETMKLIAWLNADTVNITRFSARPGTRAFDMDGQIHGRISKERSGDLTPLNTERKFERKRGLIGTSCRVLVTEPGKKGTVMARTSEYRLVVIPDVIPIGTFTDIVIEDADPNYLLGKIVK